MKIATMRYIDRFVGIPLCWITGMFRRFPQSQAAPPRTVLIIKFFGLGSVLLTSPIVYVLKKKYPEIKILYLSFSNNSEVLDQISFIDERWLIDSNSAFSFLKSFLNVFRRLALRRIDVVLDFEFFSKFSTFIGALARPTMQIGFALPTLWRRRNLSHPVILSSERHVTSSYISMLAPLGIDAQDLPHPKIRLSPSAQKQQLPVQLRAWTSDIICINPNAGETSLDRRWGAGSYAETIEILLDEYPETLLCLIGSSRERDYVQSIINRFRSGNDRVVNIAGCTSLQGLIALFLRSRILITNDSGPMHVAAAVGLSTIALFGPESPTFYGPLGNHSINLTAQLPCSPCLNMYDAKVFRCPIEAKCMKDLPVAWVADATRKMMQSTVVCEPEESVLL